MSDNKKKIEKKKKIITNRWVSLLLKIGVIAAIIGIGSLFVQIRAVHTNEMFPSVRDGDLVFTTNLLPYSFNDIILYKNTQNSEKHYGRIICLENNEVDINDSSDILVNGGIVETNNFYHSFDKGSLTYPYKVAKNSMFVLTDYKPELTDSRIYGAIHKKDIIGKVFFVFRIRGF